MTETANAMLFLHSRNVMLVLLFPIFSHFFPQSHRDVKPENILLAKGLSARITDFVRVLYKLYSLTLF